MKNFLYFFLCLVFGIPLMSMLVPAANAQQQEITNPAFCQAEASAYDVGQCLQSAKVRLDNAFKKTLDSKVAKMVMYFADSYNEYGIAQLEKTGALGAGYTGVGEAVRYEFWQIHTRLKQSGGVSYKVDIPQDADKLRKNVDVVKARLADDPEQLKRYTKAVSAFGSMAATYCKGYKADIRPYCAHTMLIQFEPMFRPFQQ